jgi:hypothetical protein
MFGFKKKSFIGKDKHRNINNKVIKSRVNILIHKFKLIMKRVILLNIRSNSHCLYIKIAILIENPPLAPKLIVCKCFNIGRMAIIKKQNYVQIIYKPNSQLKINKIMIAIQHNN